MSKSFDTEQLNALPLESVLDSLGVDFLHKKYMCPYGHKRPRSITIKHNKCKCYNCNAFPTDDKFGGPISVVMYMMKADFIEACTWLHEAFNVPYLDGSYSQETARVIPKKKKVEVEYMIFNKDEQCTSVMIKEYISKYASMQDEQRLKMVYTYLYRYALQTEQKAKFGYYKKERGIASNNTYIQTIGYLSQEDIAEVLTLMKKTFGSEDLEKFGILKRKEDKLVFAFNYVNQGGLLVVPSFDLYTDMVTGFMMRPTHPPQWMKEKGVKELQLSQTSILKPLPFGLNCKMLRENDEFFFTEGHPDLCSIPGNINSQIKRAGIASPGTYGIADEALSLFRGKKVILVYDQDFSGQKAEHGYHTLVYDTVKAQRLEFLDTKDGRKKFKEKKKILLEHNSQFETSFKMGMRQKLVLAGVKDIETLTWNKSWGEDINDLRINCNLSMVFPDRSAS